MLTIHARTVVRVLVTVVVLLTLAGLFARVVAYVWGTEGLLQPLRLLDVGEESSVPTWFSSFQLLLASGLLAAIAVADRQGGGRYAWHWGALSAIFLLLSIDEEASIHEAVGAQLERLLRDAAGFEAGGFISFFWVVPAAAFVLVVALAYLRFLAHLPGGTRRLFVVAGALFVLGALGMEMLSAEVVAASGGEARWADVGGLPKIVVGLQTSVEEMLEMLSVTVFVYALLTYVGSRIGDASVRVSLDEKRGRLPRPGSRIPSR